MHGILTRLESENDNLRTKDIKGKFEDLPIVGRSFNMLSESLTPGYDYRLIRTSIVQNVSFDGNNKYLFDTLYSKYNLEII